MSYGKINKSIFYPALLDLEVAIAKNVVYFHRPLTLKVMRASFADFCTDILSRIFFTRFLTDFLHIRHADFNGEHLSYLNKTNWPLFTMSKESLNNLLLLEDLLIQF